jgi:hypothetical protein
MCSNAVSRVLFEREREVQTVENDGHSVADELYG